MMGDELAALVLSAYNGQKDDYRPHLIGYYSKSERPPGYRRPKASIQFVVTIALK